MTRGIPLSASGRRLGVATLLASLVVIAGGAKEITIARTFGVSNTLDAYLIASAMPLAIVSLFGGAWQSAATPRLADGALGTPGPQYFRVVRRTALPLTLVSTAIAIAATLGFGPEFSAGVGVNLMLLTSSIGLAFISAGWYPVALACGRPNLVIGAPAIVHLGIALTVYLVGGTSAALYGGLLVGNVLLFATMRSFSTPSGFSNAFTIGRGSIRQVFRNLLPIAGGGIAMALALPVDIYFAANTASGGPSIVNYATRVPLAISVVGASVIATVVFADLVSKRSDLQAMRRSVGRWLLLSAASSIIAATCLWLLSSPIVDLLFASDRLTGMALHDVVEVQKVAAISIPPFLWGMVLVRSLNAMENNMALLWISTANVAVNLVGNWALAPILGLRGIMLSTAIMYCVSSLLLWLMWRHICNQGRVPA